MQNSLSAYLDGALSGEERRDLVVHLAACGVCRSRLAQMAHVRAALQNLPGKKAPSHLGTVLRVMASRERERAANRKHPFAWAFGSFRLWADNLMRPVALPFAGGLVSAVLLFSMLVPSFAFRRVTGDDVPVGLMTEPTIKAQMSFPEFDYDVDCVVEVLVDGQGRMVDYQFARGGSSITSPELRRAIEKNLLFTEFTPATMLGQPTYGRIYVSYQRRQIDIKS